MSTVTFRINIIDNKDTSNMIYCQKDGCSSYFYKLEGSNHDKCFHCRF